MKNLSEFINERLDPSILSIMDTIIKGVKYLEKHKIDKWDDKTAKLLSRMFFNHQAELMSEKDRESIQSWNIDNTYPVVKINSTFGLFGPADLLHIMNREAYKVLQKSKLDLNIDICNGCIIIGKDGQSGI